MDSRKYGRSYHYDFSLGTTSDDRINNDWYEDMQQFKTGIHTEKLDGENNCMNGRGLFSRSHAAPSRHPWCNHLKPKFSMIQNDLKVNNIELFGENLYATHSIIYPNIESHFYMFAVRCLDKWLSWEEVKWYADFFEYPIVPELKTFKVKDETKESIKNYVIEESNKPSIFGSLQNGSEILPCTKEGIVTRNIEEFSTTEFKHNLFKNVRKDHVSTDVHWSRNWKRADLLWERNAKLKK